MTLPPLDLQLIGRELALRWPDGVEDYLPAEFLRTRSPSAENLGEKDLFGKTHGGDGPKEFAGVEILHWKPVGNYAIAITFSDGHHTGLFTWKYLRALGAEFHGRG